MRYIFIALALAFSACTTTKCQIEKSMVEGLAPLIADHLQCSNLAAIEADLTKVIGGMGLCKQADVKGLPGPLCSLIANVVVDGVAKASIPATWGCTASNAKEMLSGLIVEGCKNI